MKKVFIDGAQGTTGLRIHDRLMERNDIELIRLPEELRKDPGAVGEALNQSDIAFLCLPDDAAREAVGMLNNDNTVILDTSTAPPQRTGQPRAGHTGFRNSPRNTAQRFSPVIASQYLAAMQAALLPSSTR